MDLAKLCIVALFGVFLLNPDVRYAAAFPAPASHDSGVHNNFLQNIPFVSSIVDQFSLQKVVGDIANTVGNIVDSAKTSLKTVLQQDKQQPTAYADTIAKNSSITTTTTTTTTTPAPQDNQNILNKILDFGGVLNSFQAQTSSQKSASSHNNNIFGDILDTLFRRKPPVQTTTTTTTTTTTLAPELSAAKGIATLKSNVPKLIDSCMSLIRSFSGKNHSFELGSLIQNFMKAMGSMKAIGDVFLQKDMAGGIGEVGHEIKQTMSSLKNITDIISKPMDFGRIFTLSGYIAKLYKQFMNLFEELFYPLFNISMPKQFVAIMEPFSDMCSFISKIVFPPEHIEAKNDIHSLANHTTGLANSLYHIEVMVQKQFPKIKLPISFLKFPKDVELIFANDTLNDKNILKMIEEIFPNEPLTKMAADFGNMIKKAFPNVYVAQGVARLLQDHFLVNMCINIMESSNILQFGPLKDSMLQVTGNVGTQLLKMDKHGLIVKSVQLMENYSTIIEKILELLQNVETQLKPDPKKGNPIGQVLFTNIPKAFMNRENRRMVMNIIYEIYIHLPHNVLFRFIKEVFNNGIITKTFKYLLTGGPIRDFIAFIWKIVQNIIGFISKLMYWLTGGPKRKFM